MKEYVSPEMTVNELEVIDVICTSGGLIDGGEGGGTGDIYVPDPMSLAFFE